MASHYPGGGSGVFFYREAADLERSLRDDPSPRARELCAAAHRLATIFGDWPRLRADAERKANAVRELFELNRAVLEYTGAASSTKSLPRPTRVDDDEDGE